MENKNQENDHEKIIALIYQKKAELEFLYKQTEQLKKEVK